MTDDTPTLAELEQQLADGPGPEQACAVLEAMVGQLRTTGSGSPAPLARALHRLGHARIQCGRQDTAARLWQEAAALLADGPLDPPTAQLRLDTLIDQGGLRCAERDGAAAQAPLQEAIALMQGRPGRRLVWTMNLLAQAYALSGRKPEALATLRQAEPTAQALARQTAAPQDEAAWALLLNNIGRAELAAGEAEAACDTLARCLAVTRGLIEESGTANDLTLHSAASNKYGKALERTGQLDAALPHYTETVDIMRKLVTGGRRDLAHDLEHVEADLDRLRGKLGGR